ncbi:MAG: hypothetical protein K0U47_11510 [Epsilonproteobacteria bacterium]|nr:hypothetical protein [Campylobacterota bacterium]
MEKVQKACIKAYHEMEERYARLILEYHDNAQRKEICDTVGMMIDAYNIAPAVTVTPKKDLSGEYSIEFHDDYDKQSGKFFEELIQKLGVGHCEI